jgi:hypothetical protein
MISWTEVVTSMLNSCDFSKKIFAISRRTGSSSTYRTLIIGYTGRWIGIDGFWIYTH